MSRVRTFLELQDDAYTRADEENNLTRFSRAQVGRFVNEGCAEAWGHLVDVQPKGWAENATPQTITTVANTSSYALSNTTFRIISVRFVDGTNSFNLEPFGEAVESILEDRAYSATTPAFYQFRRQTLYILPAPQYARTVKVRFVPHFTDLVNNADTWDGVVPGCDTYPAVYAAMRMFEKNAKWDDYNAMKQELSRLEQKIRTSALRDVTMPKRIQDTRQLRYHRLFTRYR